jgi:hypothetical protein
VSCDRTVRFSCYLFEFNERLLSGQEDSSVSHCRAVDKNSKVYLLSALENNFVVMPLDSGTYTDVL